jgi:predicted 2-oxoglutarate/Fe(II)-dependent dioxygenase YbiX
VAQPAEVYGSSEAAVNLSVRSVGEVTLLENGEIRQRIAALMPELAAHFHEPLDTCEDPTFLVYRPGGFYRPHRDRATRTDESAGAARARRVSIVIFLNGDYTGGALTLYGLVDDPGWRDFGFAVPPAPGLLVAFRSDLLHEVTPVTAGERFTVVTWFHA